ncbi:MAG TPA: HAD family hydrolase [Verrucomicrobiae bacterium]
MTLPIQLISTDFDGTLFSEFTNPPVPETLQAIIAHLQSKGAKWIINTGRDMNSLMETLGRGHVRIKPDYVVVVEREIHQRTGEDGHFKFSSVDPWNQRCTADQNALFALVRKDLPDLVGWVNSKFKATLYEDPWSPFCLIADNNQDADAIQVYMEAYCATIPNLTLVRNDIYARFSHAAYNKGTALAEVGRLLGIPPERTLAAGDHLNDLPMLKKQFAHALVAPSNAIPVVKAQVEREGGYLSQHPCGEGVARGIEFYMDRLLSA